MSLDLLFLSYTKRWVVAPLHREQSVGEHSYRVTIIARELCRRLGLGEGVTNRVTVHALGHDGDEFVEGDCPGPVKSAKKGYLQDVEKVGLEWCIVKVADSIETGTYWVQWGNPGAWTGHPYLAMAGPRDVEKILHYSFKMDGLLECATDVWKEITGQEMLG